MNGRTHTICFRAVSGFALLEVLFASVIMGIGFIAILASVASSTKTSYASSEITQAIFLTQEIREWTANLPFRDQDAVDASNAPGADSYSALGVPYVDDLDDLMYAVFSPPRNSLGEELTGMDGWTQMVYLSWRSSSDINMWMAPGTTDIIHVDVTVTKGNQTLMQTGWLITEEGGAE